MRPVFASSEQAKTIGNKTLTQFKAKYPWRDMVPGQSFAVEQGETSLNTLRTHAYRMGKKLGKQFRVVNHGAAGIEVACVGIKED